MEKVVLCVFFIFSSGSLSLASDQYKNIDTETGFRKVDQYYPDSQRPMSRFELDLFVAIVKIIGNHSKAIGSTDPNTEPMFLNLSQNTLLDVKLNKKGDILVNLIKKYVT